MTSIQSETDYKERHDPLPDVEVTDCQKCHGTGWLEYKVDYFGRKTEWGRCNAPGCRDGEIETEAE